MFASCFRPRRGVGRESATRRGFVLLTAAAMVALVLLPAIGLAIDAGIMYLVQSRLSAAWTPPRWPVHGRSARGIDDNTQRSNAEATANLYFTCQFPDRHFSIHQPTRDQRGGHRLHVHALDHQHRERGPAVHLPARC